MNRQQPRGGGIAMTKVEERAINNQAPGSTPVRIKKLGHIVLRVRDVERSVRFYAEVLGFQLTEIGGLGAFLNAVGDHHTLGLFAAEDGPDAQAASPSGVRLD